MKKFLKRIVTILMLVFVLLFAIGYCLNEPKPVGDTGTEAENMARKMASAVHKQAWDPIHYVAWDFMGGHHYLWDKRRHFVRLVWNDNLVLFDTKTLKGLAKKANSPLDGKSKGKLIEKAWEFFCNDSFWLNAPVKVFDPGTVRSIVHFKDGRKGLMVSYSSGGVTPGDSYVWFLDKTGIPSSWKMWVSIIPIGGLEVSWEGWREVEGGAKVATVHEAKFFQMHITGIKTAQSWEKLGFSQDPFEELADVK